MNENIHVMYAVWIFIPFAVGIAGGIAIAISYCAWSIGQDIVDAFKKRQARKNNR